MRILTFLPPRALDINFNENSAHVLCQRGPEKISSKFEKNWSIQCRKMCVFLSGNIGGIVASNVPGVTKQSLLKS